jgi:hypothetical protein
VAYLRREDEKVVRQLFDKSFIASHCFLRAKGVPEKFGRRTGPMQNDSIGFLFPEGKKDVFLNCVQKSAYKTFRTHVPLLIYVHVIVAKYRVLY